ncbi:PRC-barrel domain-containing protein [Pseudomarimonas salicorniae]|uniref:PRC-barrel domain-containing protein n=1 Tax=Pseudomarimonas salicorniae TaxID=2933270 RepID=A0ABT0GF96_9GAMM|nr:PRC-barrel domain-containing protein [Lysobacter sp. CAU 1642]MCK7593098.1 PRC-barrel domain-containing protein [Lysobacter sp. CAU 1642]
MNYTQRDPLGTYKAPFNPPLGPSTRQGPGPELMGADTLIGNSVFNGSDEDIGSIKEIMLDMRSGRIGYAVLSFGGLLGMGTKLFAVPWDALSLDVENKRFSLDVDKERLKAAPGFDADHWPNMANPDWAEGIHRYYGIEPVSSDRPI